MDFVILTHLNILLITTEQWRGDLLSAAGHPFAVTPHLDGLAADGTRFANHYCQAYPCGPARASMVTGLYAHKHRSIQNGVPLDARHATVFTEARQAGYRPRLFGYTDTTLDPRGRPDGDPDRGDYENVCPGLDVDTLLTERATPWLADLLAKGYEIDPNGGRNAVFAARGPGEPAVFAAEDSETAFLTNRFLSWLSVAGSRPWFAHISYIAPHPPFAAALSPLFTMLQVSITSCLVSMVGLAISAMQRSGALRRSTPVRRPKWTTTLGAS